MQEQRPAARDSTQSMFVVMKSWRMSEKKNTAKAARSAVVPASAER